MQPAFIFAFTLTRFSEDSGNYGAAAPEEV